MTNCLFCGMLQLFVFIYTLLKLGPLYGEPEITGRQTEQEIQDKDKRVNKNKNGLWCVEEKLKGANIEEIRKLRSSILERDASLIKSLQEKDEILMELLREKKKEIERLRKENEKGE